MTDEPMDEIPDCPDEVTQAFQNIINGAAEAAIEDAWASFKQMYECMLEAGFVRRDAIDIMSGYLYKIMSEGGTD